MIPWGCVKWNTLIYSHKWSQIASGISSEKDHLGTLIWHISLWNKTFNECTFVVKSTISMKTIAEVCSYLIKFLLLKTDAEGLPWWRRGWESACQCRGHGFEPWFGRIPHAAEQVGPWATTTEPARLEPVLPTREAAIVRGPRTAMKSGPRSPQLEKALAQKLRPNTAKNN